MVYNGADVAQLRASATQFNQVASAMESSAKAVHSMITNGATWSGPDADRFRSQWTSVSSPNIAAVVEGLRQGADLLRRNAAEQEQVSTVGGSGPVPASSYQVPPAPKGTAALYQTVHRTDGSHDGILVQQGVG